MSGQYMQIPSPDLGRRVHMWKYGYFGAPVLVFPSAGGFAHEWQQHSMITALSPLIEAGKIKLYCPESNVAEGWTRQEAHPAWRIQRHLAYERFILNTLVPFIREDCNTPNIPIAVTGTSLGAMFASLFALKHPETFPWALCMSGRYLATRFTDGFINDEIYFNSPLHFVPNLSGDALQRVRKTHLVLVCGQGAYEGGCIDETIAMAEVCQRKGIPHTRDIWGHDSAHQWPWWKRQTIHHFGRHFG
jgi:esterase/lipase superfamily enzyme